RFCPQSRLIRVGIDPVENHSNSVFVQMDDVQFALEGYKRRKDLSENRDVDIVFLDTSHLYQDTLQEIEAFVPLLSATGMLIFHDSNMCPMLDFKWLCANGTVTGRGWDNQRGVARAIQEFFNICFDETKTHNFEFQD